VYDAIRFVLGDQWGNLRATQAADLLNVRDAERRLGARARARARAPLWRAPLRRAPLSAFSHPAPPPASGRPPSAPRRTACQTA